MTMSRISSFSSVQDNTVIYTIGGCTFYRHNDKNEKHKDVYFQENYFLRALTSKEWVRADETIVAKAQEQASHLVCDDTSAMEPLVLMGLFYAPDKKRLSDKLDIIRNGKIKSKNLVGFTCVSNVLFDEKQIVLSGSYIEPEHRNKKLSRLFYQARLDWAAQNNFQKALFEPFIENKPSIAAAMNFGFKPTGRRDMMTVWGGNKPGKLAFYDLDVAIHKRNTRFNGEVV